MIHDTMDLGFEVGSVSLDLSQPVAGHSVTVTVTCFLKVFAKNLPAGGPRLVPGPGPGHSHSHPLSLSRTHHMPNIGRGSTAHRIEIRSSPHPHIYASSPAAPLLLLLLAQDPPSLFMNQTIQPEPKSC